MKPLNNNSLAYNGFAAIVATLTSQYGDSRGSAAAAFSEHCERYAREATLFWEECTKTADHGDEESNASDVLYRTITHKAFGFADSICLTLVDDLDQYFQITSDLNIPTKQVSLCFCPTLSSLDLAGLTLPQWLDPDKKGQANPFFEFDVLFRDDMRDVFAETPLLLFTQYKMGALGSLAPGAITMREVFRAIAAKVLEAQNVLLESLVCESENGCKRAKIAKQLGISREAITTLKVGFLNPQGPEELATYILCTNYSVAAFIVQYIASLTIREIAPKGSLIERLIAESQVHSVMRELCDAHHDMQEHGYTSQGGDETLEHNHVFVHSYGVLGASQTAYDDPELCGISGTVEYYPRLDVLSGHLCEVDELINTALEEPATTIIGRNDVLRVLVGRHDFGFSAMWKKKEKLRLLSIETFFQISKKLESVANSEGSGISSTTGAFVVPVIRQLPGINRDQHISVVNAIGELQRRLFLVDGAPLSLQNLDETCRRIAMPHRLARGIIHLMKHYAETLKQPSLLPAVLDLADSFAALHRLVCTELSGEFDEQINSLVAQGVEWDKARHSVAKRFFFKDRSKELGLLLTALHNAHSYRVHRHSKEEVHDWAIDVRGGLLQLVHGAVAIDICGLGLCKWGWASHFGEIKTIISTNDAPPSSSVYQPSQRRGFSDTYSDSPHSRVGVITQLSVSHRSQFTSLTNLSSRKVRTGISRFSVGHVLHPLELIDHLHESAHFILTEADDMWSPIDSLWLPEVCRQNFVSWAEGAHYDPDELGRLSPQELRNQHLNIEELSNQREEIFANLFVHLVVFGTDVDLARRYFMWRFDTSSESASDGQATREQLLEYVLRVFIISEAVDAAHNKWGTSDIATWGMIHPWREQFESLAVTDRTSLLDSLFESFSGRETDEWLTIFSRHADLVNNRRDDGLEWFTRRILIILPLFDDVWRRALQIYSRYVTSVCPTGESGKFPWRHGGQCHRSRVADAFENALKHGESSPLQALLGDDLLAADGYGFETLDPLGVVCHVLYACVRRELSRSEFKSASHFLRRADGTPDQAGSGAVDWSGSQVDMCRSHIHSANPIARRDRLRAEIACHRQVWDVSVKLRARRFVRLARSVLDNGALLRGQTQRKRPR